MLGFLATAAGLVIATGSGFALYPPIREGASLAFKDATSAYKYFNRLATGRSAPHTQTPSTAWILSDTGSIETRMQTLFSSATIVLEIVKIYQAEQIRQELKGIADQLRIHNNLVAGGSGGQDGFARHVLDFINLKVAEYTGDGRQHRFFVYHPDTHWHGAFARIRQQPGFTRQLFLGLSHDFFAVFKLMLCARVALEAEMENDAKGVAFQLLIPSYCTIVIPRSFLVVENLLPLTIDGQIAQGEHLVWLNLPREGGRARPVLNNVGNLDDLPDSSWKNATVIGATVATIFATWMVATPIAIHAVAVACPLLELPLFIAGYAGSIFATESVKAAVESAWEEPPPALLG